MTGEARRSARAVGLNVSVGRSCFVRCDGCYNHFGRAPEPTDTGKLLRFFAVAAEAGVRQITMCGGDPLSRSDVLDLLRATADLGFSIKLDTVGTALLGATTTRFYGRHEVSGVDAFTLAELVDWLGIPVDGSSNEVCTRFRAGRAHLYDEQLQILGLLSTAGARVCVNTVAHAENLHDLSAIFNAISQFPCVELWQVFQFSPTGPHGSRTRARFETSDRAFSEATEALRCEIEGSGAALVLEAKSNQSRRGRYLLVDSDGMAWVPTDLGVVGSSRVELGNIADPANDAALLGILLSTAGAGTTVTLESGSRLSRG